MPSLLDLPRELRDIIYTECLIVGVVFPYYWSSYEGYEAPGVALLQVCWRIHEEAEPMLYKRNTFVLPTADLTARFFQLGLHNDSRRAWLKSVDISFEALDLTLSDRGVVFDKLFGKYRNRMLLTDRDHSWMVGFKWELHRQVVKYLGRVVWPRKAAYVLNLGLDDLTIHLTNSKCSEGCCSMRATAVRAMKHGFAKGMPKEIDLVDFEYGRKSVDEIVNELETWTSRRLLNKPAPEGDSQVESFRSLLD